MPNIQYYVYLESMQVLVLIFFLSKILNLQEGFDYFLNKFKKLSKYKLNLKKQFILCTIKKK
jgi:hypothetical protein